MRICDNDACTGCGMCADICSRAAIDMLEDDKGFLRPEIDRKKCVECGICHTVCPANNKYDIPSQKKVYACYSKNRSARNKSSSGGIFSVLAEEIIRDGGAVIGCAWDEDFSTHHICIECIEDLRKLRGSKYVQSKTGGIYKTTKQLLEEGRKVLFCGTPCQVHALKLFLRKEYDRLFTIDLICHGVPPYRIFKMHLSEITDGAPENVSSVCLRYKKPSWLFGSVRVEQKNGEVYMQPTVKDAYFNLFNFNYSLRVSCHKCRYTNLNRTGDLTLCDFWGFYPRSMRLFGYDKGVSGVMINSEKGELLFEKIRNNIVYEQDSIERLMAGNKSLSEPFPEPENCGEFWSDFKKGMSVHEINAKYVGKPYKIPSLLRLRILKSKFRWIINEAKK